MNKQNKTTKQPQSRSFVASARSNEATTEDLEEAYEEIAALYTSAVASEMQKKYKIGQKLQDVCGDDEKYGKRAVETIAQRLGLTDDSLYSYKRVAEAFSPEDFEELCQRRDGDYCLTFTHLVLLQGASLSDRSQLIELAFDKHLSTHRLGEEIDARLPVGKDRLARPPASPLLGLKQLTTIHDEYLRISQKVSASISAGVEEIRTERWSEHLFLYKEAEAAAKLALQQAEKNLHLLSEARKKLESKISEEHRRDQSPKVAARPERKTRPAAA